MTEHNNNEFPLNNFTSECAPEPLAIVGIGCRLPGGSKSPDIFWDNLLAGKDCIVDVPDNRWDIKKFYDENKNKSGKMHVKSGGFLQEKIDEFDALFFGISPREANSLDPQQRLLLEVSWEAFEDAGIDPESLAGSNTGVFIGGFMMDNKLTQFSPLNRHTIASNTAVGMSLTMLSNRLSYTYDLRGPSISIDTACSSSMVALDQACRSIWTGDSSIALVGGATGMIGDPSGKSDERNLLDEETLAKTVAGVGAVLSRFLDFNDSETGDLTDLKATKNQKEFDFLQMVVGINKEILKENDEAVSVSPYQRPQISLTSFEKKKKLATFKMNKANVKDSINDLFKNKEDELDYGDLEAMDSGAKIIPKMYLNQLEDPEIISENTIWALIMSHRQSVLYNERTTEIGNLLSIQKGVEQQSFENKINLLDFLNPSVKPPQPANKSIVLNINYYSFLGFSYLI